MPEKDDGSIKTLAILKEIDGRREEAEDILNRNIEEMSNHAGRWARDHSYYFKCVLAEILLARNDLDSIDKVINLLEPECNKDLVGEANYYMARAWLFKHNTKSVERHLRAAATLRRKWIMKAKHDPGFKSYDDLDELISQYV